MFSIFRVAAKLCRPPMCRKSATDLTAFKPHKQPFHVSSFRKAVPPVLLLLLKPAARLGAFLFGRNIRLWWRKLSPEAKEVYLRRLRKNRNYFLGIAGGLAFSGGIFYVTHLESAPITGRRRFVFVSEDSLDQLSKLEFEAFLTQYGSSVLPPRHRIYKKVTKIANRLLEANKDIEEIYTKDWSVTVFEEPEIANAAVLPSGAILIFSGLLDRCASEDEFANILAHELSHSILRHAAELVSRSTILETIKTVLIGVCMAVSPTDVTGLLSFLFGSATLTAGFELPYGRDLEREADEVGMKLAAKACYDVRSAAVFWEKMRILEELELGAEMPSFVSTHPANASRRDYLKSLEEEAIGIMEECKCPKLRQKNFEKEIEEFRKAIEIKHKHRFPEIVRLKIPMRPDVKS